MHRHGRLQLLFLAAVASQRMWHTPSEFTRLQTCANALIEGGASSGFRLPAAVEMTNNSTTNMSWFDHSWARRHRAFLGNEDQRKALRAWAAGRNATIYVMGDSCIRELSNRSGNTTNTSR